MARQPKQEKQPHLAWRITRTVLDVLGKIILVLLIAVGTVALIAAIAGSIFLSKFKSYVELDILPTAGSPMTIFPLTSSTRPFPSRTSASPRTRAWTGSAHWQP